MTLCERHPSLLGNELVLSILNWLTLLSGPEVNWHGAASIHAAKLPQNRVSEFQIVPERYLGEHKPGATFPCAREFPFLFNVTVVPFSPSLQLSGSFGL